MLKGEDMSKLTLFAVVVLTNLTLLNSAVASENSDTCNFSQTSPGILVTQGNHKPNKLVSSSEIGGSPIQFNVTCNQPANLTISAPIQISGPVFTPVSSIATVTTSYGGSAKNGDAPITLPAGTTPLSINLFIDGGDSLRAGNYSYTVKLTVNP
jgi:hypothetical protein